MGIGFGAEFTAVMTPNTLASARVRAGSIVRFKIAQQRWHSFLRVSEEVRAAVNARKPVVALETTIYTHGMDRHH